MVIDHLIPPRSATRVHPPGSGFPFVLVLSFAVLVLVIDAGILRSWLLGDGIGSRNQLG